jgi:hypothetical protein
MLRTEFAVKMAEVLARVRINDLTTVLNKEGFASMYDVTPDKFQTIIDLFHSVAQHSQVRTDLFNKLYLSLNLRYYFFFIIHSLAPLLFQFVYMLLLS